MWSAITACKVRRKKEGYMIIIFQKKKKKGIEIWALILNHSSEVLAHNTRKIKESLQRCIIFNASKVFIIIYTVDIDLKLENISLKYNQHMHYISHTINLNFTLNSNSTEAQTLRFRWFLLCICCASPFGDHPWPWSKGRPLLWWSLAAF